jgi:hypothetical protein
MSGREDQLQDFLRSFRSEDCEKINDALGGAERNNLFQQFKACPDCAQLRATIARLRDLERSERTLNRDTRFLMRLREILEGE